jgi:pimeloyl-ACP methyl ester carboxylesterase
MSLILTLPRLGETMEEGRIVGWIKRPGEPFRRGETLVEIETDKTVVELPAVVDGVLEEILAAEGVQIRVGDPLCRYVGEALKAQNHEGDSRSVAELEAAGAPFEHPDRRLAALPTEFYRCRATPKARRMARQRGVELAAILGTGRRSRIEARDVETYVPRATQKLESNAEPELHQGPGLQFSDAPLGCIAYREWSGQVARPLLLAIHGFGGDAQTWSLLARILSRRGQRVLALDLPSHGATPVIAKGIDDLVELVGDFIDRLPEPSVDLVGHSLGGAVAARVALRLKKRVNRITLIAPAGVGTEIDAQFIDGLAQVNTGEGLRHLLQRIALRPPVLSSRELDAMATSLGLGQRLVALGANIVRDGRQQIDILSDLKSLEGRVRLIWGLDDRVIPWMQATRVGSGIPVHFIAKAGHMPQWDRPEKLASLFS